MSLSNTKNFMTWFRESFQNKNSCMIMSACSTNVPGSSRPKCFLAGLFILFVALMILGIYHVLHVSILYNICLRSQARSPFDVQQAASLAAINQMVPWWYYWLVGISWHVCTTEAGAGSWKNLLLTHSSVIISYTPWLWIDSSGKAFPILLRDPLQFSIIAFV